MAWSTTKLITIFNVAKLLIFLFDQNLKYNHDP
jgi:hypothetical protein